MSNYSSRQLAEAQDFAPVVSNQIKYSLLERGIESDPLPFCRQKNVAVICYSPLAMGILTGKVTAGRQFPASDIRSKNPWYQPAARAKVLDALDRISQIADAHDATPGQIAIAWVLAQEGVTTALVGARNPQQVQENAKAGDIKLAQDELAVINKGVRGDHAVGLFLRAFRFEEVRHLLVAGDA